MPLDLRHTRPPHRFNIRLACFDIDGTIVDRFGTIAPAVLSEMQRIARQGVRIGIASGRPYFAAREICNTIGVDAPSLFFSGALVVEPRTDNILLEAPLEPQTVLTLLAEAEKAKLVCELYTRHEYFVAQIAPVTRKHATYLKQLPQERALRDVALSSSILKVVIIAEGTEEHQRLRDICETALVPVGLSTGAAHPEILFGNFTSPEAKREIGFQRIIDALQLTADQVAAFGDAEADLPFLLRAGAGVAMANAPLAVIDHSPFVTASVEEQGVALALRALVPLRS